MKLLNFPSLKKTVRGLVYFSALFMTACSSHKDDPSPSASVAVKYAISNVGGAYPSQTTYVQGLADLNVATLDNSKATELSSFASQWAYGGAVYLSAFGAPATLTKYTFDANGKAVVAAKLIVPGANTFSSVEFVSSTEAYASVGGGLARVIKFNPSALQTTGEIDLSSVLKPAAASTYYLGMKARDGKLFLGVQYFDKSFNPLDDIAHVIVIDLATAKVDKLINDSRTSNIFLAGSSVSGFAIDAAGDLYIEGQGSGNAPSGILRIKKGSTDFDTSYFLNLKAATGKDCSGLYILNGLAFTTQIQDPTDAYEFNGPNFRYYKIDLANQKSLGDLSSSLPNIFGSRTSIMRAFDNQNITFVVSGKSENSIYNYNISSGAIAKKTSLTSGTCTGLDKLN
ncbi:hypothetical protein [Mucilaginibacter sp. KACC 22063]|uniref:hypothetical protein n=1 Tax=Mucilaginibacter sp. KACC 22063 TaxID=3025666 RepID=UPI002366D3A9|nr:hypothetical protein [Mucilaginibacter sp. KACC 22063]WDF55782.1 hypothetical protein PQ461_01740 [Mucilaginibacter sp. KACC 22063]